MQIIQLNESNFRDPVAELRRIAQEIEDGTYGAVGSGAVVIMGDTLEVFRFGQDCEAPSVALLLQAANLRMAKAIEEHGR